jgi:hypothetical protein
MKIEKIIYAIAISLTLLINSVLVTNSLTRRSADELMKINAGQISQIECKDMGGNAHYRADGIYYYCDVTPINK